MHHYYFLYIIMQEENNNDNNMISVNLNDLKAKIHKKEDIVNVSRELG